MLQAVRQRRRRGHSRRRAIFGLYITNGIIGNFTINETGDTT